MDACQPETACGTEDRGSPAGETSSRDSHSLDFLRESSAPLRLAGSVLTVPTDARERAAAQLSAAGLEVHIDVIDDSYPVRFGVDPQLAATLADGAGDIHLMVRDPLSTLDHILPLKPAQVTVQLEDLGKDPAAALEIFVRRCRNANASPHLAIAPRSSREMLAPLMDLVDGVLVMLSPPGESGGRADLACLDGISTDPKTLTVDGGARPELFDALRARGVDRVVMGRALTRMLA